MRLFDRRQIRITWSADEAQRITRLLLDACIETTTRSASIRNPGRCHGAWGIRSDYAYEYRVYVRRADYARAERVLNG